MDKGLPAAKRILRSAAGIAALGTAALASPAHAGIEFAAAAMIRDAVSNCPLAARPLSPASAPVAAITKTAALLGGAPSALDAIRAQQATVIDAAIPAPAQLADAAARLPVLTPGVDASSPIAAVCASLAASRADARPGMLASLAADPENFLASKRVRIGRTNFDREWKRVRGETIAPGVLRRFVGGTASSREDTLAEINRGVNQRIRYAEDSDQYGKADYWAGARRTLKTGRGDCEDIALTKMQLLAAAGIPRDDMILTIARDLVRNADHAVLIVRTDSGYRMLDNATDAVLDAAPGHDYRPILSFGNQTSWLHGV